MQRRIAGILSAYDELMENSQRRIRILEAMARALYREWFVHFRFPGHEKLPRVASPLGDIPQGWEVKRVPECVDINPRVVVPRDGEKPFVPMGCLSNDSMLITDIESRAGNSGAKFQNGDTLFARITPCLENGKTGFVQFLPDARSRRMRSTEFIVLRSAHAHARVRLLPARSDEFRGVAIKSMSGATGRQRVQEQCFDDFQIAPATASLARPLLRHRRAELPPASTALHLPNPKPPPDARPAAAASAVGAGGTQNGGRMSSLSMADRQILEQHFGMEGGYVLNFSDRTFGEFVSRGCWPGDSRREIHNRRNF